MPGRQSRWSSKDPEHRDIQDSEFLEIWVQYPGIDLAGGVRDGQVIDRLHGELSNRLVRFPLAIGMTREH